MSRSQKGGHVLILWLPDSPRDCWVFSPFPLLSPVRSNSIHFGLYTLGCISDGYSSVFPYFGSNLFPVEGPHC